MNEATAGGTRVRMIPATVRRYATTRPLTERLRVAAYARVSTDDEEQLTSYEAQVDYYTKKIRENPDWTFVEVYADEGISGTNTKKRKNFNRMIDDAKLKEQLTVKAGRKRKLEAFIDKIKNTTRLISFDEQLFAGTVEQVIVNHSKTKNEKTLTFCFRDGTEITV